jgi:CoA:oxalate CoA-transferase
MKKALEGTRVLDLTNVLAGPLCAYQLALLGAEVIKVETPGGGDLARQLGNDRELNAKLMGASFLAQNAGKKSITANLKSTDGKELLRRLVATADVLVENFRPGVMDRLGLGYEDLRKLNPRLVYCAITGFGQEGPLRDAPAYDQIIQGLSGMMSVTGDARCAPLRAGYPVADTVSGMVGAYAICAALLRRHGTGEGGFIDVAMLDSALVAMGWVVSNYLIAGTEPQPHGNDNFTAAPSGTFRTGTGPLNIAANKQDQFETLAQLIGRAQLIEDPRFAEREARKQNRAALTAAIEEALAQRPAEEWETLFTRAGVPAGCVLSVPQALHSPQLATREFVQEFEDVPGVGRTVRVGRTGFKLSDSDPQASAPPPVLGAHTEEVLGGLGYSKSQIAELRKVGAI